MKVARWSIAILFFLLIYIYFFGVKPEKDLILEREVDITEITVVNKNFENTGYYPNTSLGYLRWIGFEKIIFQEEIFHQIGSGASFIYPAEQASKFVVENIIESRDIHGRKYNFQRIYIKNQISGKILAYKEWKCSKSNCDISADNAKGWQGQYGALFVRDVLNPSLPIKGAVGVIPYPKTVYTFHSIKNKTETKSAKEVQETLFNCPNDFSIIARKDIPARVLHFNNRMFFPAHSIRQVHCLKGEVFVISNTFPQDIFLDWFSYSGDLLGQFRAQLNDVDTTDYMFISAISRNGEKIRLSVSYFNPWPNQPNKVKPYAEFEILVDINASERRH